MKPKKLNAYQTTYNLNPTLYPNHWIIEKQFFIKDGILDILKLHQHNELTEMDASLVGAPVFKTVCVALILSQVGSIPTHLRHFI